MGSTEQRQTELIAGMGPIRAVRDPLVGPLLIVGGACPAVKRIVSARGLLTYNFVEIDGAEYTDGSKTEWPEIVPRDMLHYRYVTLVPFAHLRPVDLVAVIYGQYADAGRICCLWQACYGKAGQLTLLNDTEVRSALASPWVRRMRENGELVRAISLQE